MIIHFIIMSDIYVCVCLFAVHMIKHLTQCNLRLFLSYWVFFFLLSLLVFRIFLGFFFQLLEHLPHLFTCLQHPYTAVRHMAARCTGVFSKIAMLETMNIFLERVLPWLAAIDDCTKQEGAIEALACILY